MFEGKTTGTPIGLLIRNTDQNRKITAILLRLLDRVMRTTPIHKMVSVITVVAVVRVHVKLRCVLQRVLLLKYLAEKFGVLIRGHVTQIGNEVAENWIGMKFQIIRFSVAM